MFSMLVFPAILAGPVWLIAVLVKLISVCLPGRRADWSVDLLRWCAGMSVAAVVGLCAWGVGTVQLLTHESESGANSSPSPACREALPTAVENISGYRPSYVPLGFDCVLNDGTTYPSSSGYAWANALIVGFGVSAVVLVVAAGHARARRAPGAGAPRESCPTGDDR
ncbi:hypothetical protein ABZS61_27105 [Streptomyces sp. NPDC005566]|uniref:hypothetical protein n=1 Tax=Streptomyces sp. NPDC005566 TaxID=3156886 RepID=UPI0033BB7C3C